MLKKYGQRQLYKTLGNLFIEISLLLRFSRHAARFSGVFFCAYWGWIATRPTRFILAARAGGRSCRTSPRSTSRTDSTRYTNTPTGTRKATETTCSRWTLRTNYGTATATLRPDTTSFTGPPNITSSTSLTTVTARTGSTRFSDKSWHPRCADNDPFDD